jgi:hypothetical protein
MSVRIAWPMARSHCSRDMSWVQLRLVPSCTAEGQASYEHCTVYCRSTAECTNECTSESTVPSCWAALLFYPLFFLSSSSSSCTRHHLHDPLLPAGHRSVRPLARTGIPYLMSPSGRRQ